MADISKITLPNGTTYNLKDETARAAASAGIQFVLAEDAATTPRGVEWKSGGTTITGTLDPSATTMGKIYLVLASHDETKDIYSEYVTVYHTTGVNYSWERLGNTEINLDNLGSLAYKDSVSGTPSGTVSSPSINLTPTDFSQFYAVASSMDEGEVTAGSAASFTATVSNETLTLGFTANTPTAVTLPTFTSKTVPTEFSAAAGLITFSGNTMVSS